MLDEPSAGLSPVLVDRVFVVVRRLRETGTAVLLVEQLIEKALALADRVYALARGSIVLEAKHRRGRSAEPAGARLFRDRGKVTSPYVMTAPDPERICDLRTFQSLVTLRLFIADDHGIATRQFHARSCRRNRSRSKPVGAIWLL